LQAERCRNDFVVRQDLCEKGKKDEADRLIDSGDGSAFGLCDHATAACDADLRGRFANSGDATLPATPATAADRLS
jgi:hypothetical protein